MGRSVRGGYESSGRSVDELAPPKTAAKDDDKSVVYVVTVPGQEGFHPEIKWDDSFGKWVCSNEGGRYATGNDPKTVLRTIKNRFGQSTTIAPKTGKTANRACETCGGAMPNRQSRQRNEKGQLVCDSCKANPQPEWTTTHGSLSVLDQSEMRRREAEAITSIVRVRKARHTAGRYSAPCPKCGKTVSFSWQHGARVWKKHNQPDGKPCSMTLDVPSSEAMRHTAHDSGDSATIHHCPFCGSGAVIGSPDGTVTCQFCHSPFTVQVQPSHPFMPQTIDGQPVTPPGMPGGTPEPTEMSAPVDPTVEETEEDVAADPLGDADPTQQPPKQPNPFEKKDEPPKKKPGGGGGGGKPPWLKNKSSVTPRCGKCGQPLVLANGLGKGPDEWVHAYPEEIEDGHDAVPSDKKSSRTAGLGWVEGPSGTSRTQYREDFTTPQMAMIEEDFDRAGHWFPAVVDRTTGNITWVDDQSYPEAEAKSVAEGRLGKQSSRSFRTAEGRTLDTEAYMARLALENADDREAVLEQVRVTNMQREAINKVTCPTCRGDGRVDRGGRPLDRPNAEAIACPTCGGHGVIDADDPEHFELREPPHEAAMRPFVASGETTPTPSALFGTDENRKANNEDRAYDKGLTPCTTCGRGVSAGRGWVVEVIDGGANIAKPGTADNTDSGYMGAWLLGPECAKAVPIEFRQKADESWYTASLRTSAAILSHREAAKGLVRYEINAEDIQEGDFLDIMGRARVDKRHPRTDRVLVRTKNTGARSPSVQEWQVGEQIKVWRRS